MSQIRVMIVEDSAVVRALLEHLVASDPRLEIGASCRTAEEACRLLARIEPDVISMDIQLPGMNGLDATRKIMAEQPTPIVVVSAIAEGDVGTAMNALRCGALAVVEKPVGTTHADYAAIAERLCTQLAIMSRVPVITRRGLPTAPPRRPRPPPPAASPGPAAARGPFSMLGIVASTGGPRALEVVLGGLPADFPLPVALVQHITGNFLPGFVRWLDGLCALQVVEAEHGAEPQAGRVYVAPADRHLQVDGRRLRLDRGPPVCAQRPSGTVLLESMAKSLGARALGVLLTGMGEDGALGLRDVRQAGGHTIAEHESTAVVYGMPRAAAELGAACDVLPLPEIALRIEGLVRRCARERGRDVPAKLAQ